MRARVRLVAIVLGLGGVAATGASTIVHAAPQHNRGLTITATPRTVLAGEGVLIYGRLQGPAAAGQTIILYHRVDPARHFSVIGKTTTDAAGFYEFVREANVLTNRSWFARGPSGSQSRTVHERVSALVSITAAQTGADTAEPVTFTGSVAPAHRFQPVLLQAEGGSSGSGWRTIETVVTDGQSHFTATHRWLQPGDYVVRAKLKADARNVASVSDGTTVIVEQKNRPAFTIASSAPTIAEGQSVTISGVLDAAGTATPKAATGVTLYGSTSGGPPAALATTTTAADGSYSFTETPVHNEVFQVGTTLPPARTTAKLYEGVQDVLAIVASSTTSTVGDTDTISGIVEPDRAGDEVTLQREGADGAWHDVRVGIVTSLSTYSFVYTFGHVGVVNLRARIDGDAGNIGAASPPLSITVNGVPPLSTLPPA
jgi:hypothetical protein